MTLRISVVVASRGRPAMLARCLSALEQLIWPAFEVVVVADKAGRDVLSGRTDIKLVACDQPNLSLARNLGISSSAGEIIAFIDDDAVPEPMWLHALGNSFEDAAVGAATGPVLGRNGISLQSGAQTILTNGRTTDALRDPSRRRMNGDRAPKTVGTNMAFRADLLRSAGGFDESYRYYMEDSDLNVRLGKLGALTAYEPLALVHHATAPSRRRRSDRTPRDLHEIGRSSALFLQRYAEGSMIGALEDLRRDEWNRIDRKLMSGHLEPRDARRLRRSFEQGVEEGKQIERTEPSILGPAKSTFLQYKSSRRGHAIVCAGIWRRKEAFEAAIAERNQGRIVSLFVFSRSSLFHRVEYRNGVWVQQGGAFGRSDRSDPLFRLFTLRKRYETEIARVSSPRGIPGGFDKQTHEKNGFREVRLSFF